VTNFLFALRFIFLLHNVYLCFNKLLQLVKAAGKSCCLEDYQRTTLTGAILRILPVPAPFHFPHQVGRMKPRDYCCCAIPAINAGIYAVLTEQLVLGIVAGTLSIATPSSQFNFNLVMELHLKLSIYCSRWCGYPFLCEMDIFYRVLCRCCHSSLRFYWCCECERNPKLLIKIDDGF